MGFAYTELLLRMLMMMMLLLLGRLQRRIQEWMLQQFSGSRPGFRVESNAEFDKLSGILVGDLVEGKRLDATRDLFKDLRLVLALQRNE